MGCAGPHHRGRRGASLPGRTSRCPAVVLRLPGARGGSDGLCRAPSPREARSQPPRTHEQVPPVLLRLPGARGGSDGLCRAPSPREARGQPPRSQEQVPRRRAAAARPLQRRAEAGRPCRSSSTSRSLDSRLACPSQQLPIV
uniref:Uncharacterized protein n=1 Tax=Molossus molossus TaxID=27622 RepID=A0A7J8GKM5_MOLMO|nr:hypothetical protein HJG59_011431 [Molossus molossus]